MTFESRKHHLIEIDWPEFGLAACPPRPPTFELEARIDKLRARMDELKLTHTVIYGDREHFANLAYLTGFDPRFEESLLIVGRTGSPLILVGNECEAYLGISSLYNAKQLRHELFQSFWKRPTFR
jgi:creatinase/prolidase-like protein